MQTLKLNDGLLVWAHEGRKRGTSRRGRRDIQLAPLRLEATHGTIAALTVDVKSVTYIRLRNAPQAIAESEGYSTQEEMFASLKRFYPDCSMDDEFTLVEW